MVWFLLRVISPFDRGHILIWQAAYQVQVIENKYLLPPSRSANLVNVANVANLPKA